MLSSDYFDFTVLKEGTANRAKRCATPCAMYALTAGRYRISLTDCLLLAPLVRRTSLLATQLTGYAVYIFTEAAGATTDSYRLVADELRHGGYL